MPNVKTKVQIESNLTDDVVGVIFNITFADPVKREDVIEMISDFQNRVKQLAESCTTRYEQLNS